MSWILMRRTSVRPRGLSQRSPLAARLAAGAALMAMALAPVPPAWAATPSPDPSSLTLAVAPASGLPLSLTLTASVPASLAAGAGSVDFFVVTTEFGKPQLVPLGAARLNPNGLASSSYKPTWDGRQEFVAKLASPASDPATATAYYQVTNSAPGSLYATANPAKLFSPAGNAFVIALLTIVALVWLTLLATLWRVAHLLPGLASDARARWP